MESYDEHNSLFFALVSGQNHDRMAEVAIGNFPVRERERLAISPFW